MSVGIGLSSTTIVMRVNLSVEYIVYTISKSTYRTRAIITRGLYILYPIFHCGLYCRAISVTDNYVLNKEILQIFGSKISYQLVIVAQVR